MQQRLTQPERAADPSGAADHSFSLPDGRKLGYRIFGDPAGTPVIALHGTPGSRFKYAGSHRAARAAGLQLIAIDRWGYGLSSSHPGARLAGFAADVKALANHLKLETFAITGVSGGAPFAVACAAALGERVSALALVSPVGLIAGQVRGARLRAFHTVCFRILPHIPGAIGLVFQLYRAGLNLAPNWALTVAISRSANVDRLAMVDRETRRRLIETFEQGLRFGVEGPKTDMALFAVPWGIDFAAVRATTRIWIGLEDRNVPLPAVYALAAALPDCELTELPAAGHLWVAQNAHDVMSWLSQQSAQYELMDQVDNVRDQRN